MSPRNRSSGGNEEPSPQQQKLSIELCTLLLENKALWADDPKTPSFETCLRQECHNRQGPVPRAAISERLMDLLHCVQTGEKKAFEFALRRLSLLAACIVHRPEIERKGGPRVWYADQGAWKAAMNVLGLQGHGDSNKKRDRVEEDGEDTLIAKKHDHGARFVPARKLNSGNFPGTMNLLDEVSTEPCSSRISQEGGVTGWRSLSEQTTPEPSSTCREDTVITPPDSAVSAYGPAKPFDFTTSSFVQYSNSAVSSHGPGKPLELAWSPLAQDLCSAIVPNGLKSPFRPSISPLAPSPDLPVVANVPQTSYEPSAPPSTQYPTSASSANGLQYPFDFSAPPWLQQPSSIVSSTSPQDLFTSSISPPAQHPTSAVSSTNPQDILTLPASSSAQPSVDLTSCNSAAIWTDGVFGWCSTCLPAASADTGVPRNKCGVSGWVNVCGWCCCCLVAAWALPDGGKEDGGEVIGAGPIGVAEDEAEESHSAGEECKGEFDPGVQDSVPAGEVAVDGQSSQPAGGFEVDVQNLRPLGGFEVDVPDSIPTILNSNIDDQDALPASDLDVAAQDALPYQLVRRVTSP